ncbi:MAG: MFS transporter, partial [Phycisphaeraceae bacterium]
MPEPALRYEPPPLRRNVSFMLMWASVVASGFGDRLIQLVAWTLLGMGEQGIDASSVQASVYFFFFIPYLVFSPVGGWLADTLPRKWIMFGCDQSRALIMLAAFVLVPAGAARAIPAGHVLFEIALPGGTLQFTGHHGVFAIVFGVGLMAAIFGPTRNATVPQIVRPRDLQGANAIILGLAVIASLIGMLVGGWVIDALDSLHAGLIIAILAFSISGCFFIFLRIRQRTRAPRAERPSQWRRLIEGVSYIARHKPVLQLVILGVLFWASSHVIVAAIAALNARHYDLPSPLIVAITGDPADAALVLHLAVMSSVLGLGMLTTALVVSFFNTR